MKHASEITAKTRTIDEHIIMSGVITFAQSYLRNLKEKQILIKLNRKKELFINGNKLFPNK